MLRTILIAGTLAGCTTLPPELPRNRTLVEICQQVDCSYYKQPVKQVEVINPTTTVVIIKE